MKDLGLNGEQDKIPSFGKMQVTVHLLDEKVTQFSELEVEGQDVFTAVKTMLLNERVKVPAWVRFFTMYGLLMFRRNSIKLAEAQK